MIKKLFYKLLNKIVPTKYLQEKVRYYPHFFIKEIPEEVLVNEVFYNDKIFKKMLQEKYQIHTLTTKVMVSHHLNGKETKKHIKYNCARQLAEKIINYMDVEIIKSFYIDYAQYQYVIRVLLPEKYTEQINKEKEENIY